MKKTYRVRADIEYIVTIDDELLPDDEWRSVFYNFRTMEQVVEHFVWNRKIKQFRDVEGFCGVPLADEVVIEEGDWEWDTEEIKEDEIAW